MNYLQSLENSVKNIKHSGRQEAISPSCAKDLCNRPEKAVSVMESSCVEPNNNEILSKLEQEQPSQGEENISVGDEKETEAKGEQEEVTTDESFIDVDEEEEQSKEQGEEQEKEEQEQEKEEEQEKEDRSGLFLLAEAAIPPAGQARKIRFASTDCSGLEMLSDLADQREKAVVVGTRIERSKSLDWSASTELRNDIKQFVKSKSVKSPADSQSEDKLDNMAAWELDLRIQMAEKQRKYNEINRKLLKIQKIKKKSIKKNKNRIKIKKMKKKIKYEVQNIETKISSRGHKQAELTETPPPPPTPPSIPSAPTPPSPSPASPPDSLVPEMPDEPNLPESLEMSEVVEEEGKEQPPHMVNSFTETFQKFKQSYLSRTGGDSRLAASKAKKIPTLENWRTIMQGNRKKKENQEENKSPEETCFNNNLFENSTRVKNSGEKYLLHHKKRIKSELYKEEDHVKLSQSKHSEAPSDQDNNNKLTNWKPEETEETFLSFKKKLKKKHKEQLLAHKVVEAETPAVEPSEKRKKKKKKEKKEKKEKRDKEKKIRRKERKERKGRKVSEEAPPPLLVAEVETSLPAGSTSDLPPTLQPEPEPGQTGCCLLAESDLVDGLRVLLRLGGHFYTSRLTEISPPDIYGIVVDRERGNKPHILSREEVLTQAVSLITVIFRKKVSLTLSSLCPGYRRSARQCVLPETREASVRLLEQQDDLPPPGDCHGPGHRHQLRRHPAGRRRQPRHPHRPGPLPPGQLSHRW